MKKIKIILLTATVVVLVVLNISVISSNGNVEEVYLGLMPENALADGQCWLEYGSVLCFCDIQYGPLCGGNHCQDLVVRCKGNETELDECSD